MAKRSIEPPRPPVPELVAHRGAKRERPENTLGAFARAIELGADALELDVHATRDGVVVVHHDPVTRAVDADGERESRPIAALTHGELRRVRVDGEPIPTLAEVLELAGGRVVVYVELKGAGIERPVVDAVRASGASCAIHSFDHPAIGRVAALAPEIPRGLLFEHADADMLGAMARYDARDLWPAVNLVSAALIDAAHRGGRRVIVWTVNDRADAQRLASLEVDALCGDDIPLLRAALAMRGL